jgi:uncharacterized membrane protein YedE/YeeE
MARALRSARVPYWRGAVPRPLPLLFAVLIAGAIAAGVLVLSSDGTAAGRSLGFSLALGAAFGLTLQRARFCFFCHTRDLIESRDPRGVLAILLALAVGTVGYVVVFGAWLPVPAADRLPPTAHIGPVSPVLALAAFAFGVGMAIAGSCISAQFYRLGEGSPTAPFAIAGTVIGFVIGFTTWNSLFLSWISVAPIVWLPHQFGYAGTLALSVAVLSLLAYAALRASRAQVEDRKAAPLGVGQVLKATFVERWPAYVGGLLVGVLSAVAYLRVAPLGVTAELGSLARTGAERMAMLPSTLYGLDGFRGCATAIKSALVSDNGMFVAGLIFASLATALVAGQFKPQWPKRDEIVRGLAGGTLMGWGAMTALGCTVGTLLSGIHAGALSGWVFLFFCFFGVAAGLWLRRRFVF